MEGMTKLSDRINKSINVSKRREGGEKDLREVLRRDGNDLRSRSRRGFDDMKAGVVVREL